MRLESIKIIDGGFLITVRKLRWKGWRPKVESVTYFTRYGTHYYDSDGNRPWLETEIALDRLFEPRVDWLNRKFWHPVHHPSPRHIPQRVEREEAARARQLIGKTLS